MKSEDIKFIQEIKEKLIKNTDHKFQERVKKFSKCQIITYGLRTPVTRKISANYFSKIKKRSKQDIFDLCELLLKSGYSEERTIAFDWAFRVKRQYTLSDFERFESWLRTFVTGWGSCDDFCTHALGAFIFQFPEVIPEVKKWAESDNRWLKRASAVVFIYSIRRDTYIEHGFEIADILLLDHDDMVQKGYGWMLKEISNLYPQKVFEYVMQKKDVMPRTSLRYAIEKLSPELKKKAMAKN
ncbi:MAG: DNA alkylation repair protein [Theionarchaea archaeon]|nr:DNA alkylation repair protein [Theionarchaea archaeon]